ncbi:MAG: LTA synthase family protein [Prevotella sp.]|nr:LTA synthase family protein [Prevotella sp.]
MLWLYWVVVFLVQKPLFMLWYHGLYADCGATDYLSVMLHGLQLDMSMAGYLVSLPLLLVLVSVWKPFRALRGIARFWLAASACLVAFSFLLNIILYEYWGFPLDSTPLFYFFSSPKDAFASMGIGGIIIGIVAWLLVSVLFYEGACLAFGLKSFCKNKLPLLPTQLLTSLLLLILCGLTFLVIRGGFSVSSMNTGRVYFSEQPAINHAAVNPLFSLMESLSHENDFASQYRFMDDAKATQLAARLTPKGNGPSEMLLKNQRPDIYIIILESFSSKLMKTLGGNGVATELDTLAQQGILFTHFYANSFRTDRGLVSILSGYPAQPTMSLMKYPRKTQSLSSVPAVLKKNGYQLRYYYGGDADFTNMRSYLIGQGIEDIISDVSFPVKDRLSKWGVHDHILFQRVAEDAAKENSKSPLLRIVQTSSSHEPFEVPYHKLSDERLNAFAYTDSCVGGFIRQLQASARWQNTLVVFVPDHLGAYPKDIKNTDFSRYEIPLIMVGGAIAVPRQISTIGSQQDIAATLLAQLGLSHDDFPFSKDLMDSTIPHFAFFAVPDAFGLVTNEQRFIYDNKSARVVAGKADDNDTLLQMGKAYLQIIYDDIATK